MCHILYFVYNVMILPFNIYMPIKNNRKIDINDSRYKRPTDCDQTFLIVPLETDVRRPLIAKLIYRTFYVVR